MKLHMIVLLKITTIKDIFKITTLIISTDIEITIDIEATVEIIHKTIIDRILDKDISIDLQVHTHLDPDLTPIVKEELHPDLHTEIFPNIDTIPDQDKDLLLNHKETPSEDTITHIDLHLDQEVTDQDPGHPHKTNKTE